MKAKIATPAEQGGVFLLEVLVAILILSFAILGLVAMQARAIGYSVDAEDRNRAALLANEMVTTMWSQQTTDAGSLSSQIADWQTRVQAALPPYDSSVTATVGDPDADGAVTVTISWTPVGASATTHTYVTQVAMP
jgi:type IV pilus assembly protein PilV